MAYRSWACPCCGLEYRRRKQETYGWSCQTCNRRMVAARVPRQRRTCSHAKARARWQAWKERDAAYPRTRAGRRLRPPADVKKAWFAVQQARTRPAVARRGQKFITALLGYSRDHRDPDGTTRWRITYLLRNGRLERRKESGGLNGMPRVVLVHRSGEWGSYHRDVFGGKYEISLDPQHANPEELRRTLVHEALHLLDDEAHTKNGGHDRLWEKRLAEMMRLFPVTEARR